MAKYSTIEEKRAANARQKRESQQRNGNKDQNKYHKFTGWKHKKARSDLVEVGHNSWRCILKAKRIG